MALSVEISVASALEGAADLPEPASIEAWAAAGAEGLAAHVDVRVVDAEEMQSLNRDFRGKDRPTNVLSFPADADLPLPGPPLLGDIALCAPVIAREAAEQGKPPEDHWAHLVIHGILHLRGFDHISDSEAEEMESLERCLLEKLGIPDPYR
ncbi:MAG: rRNA maturation RNase YbeY [Pseudomonadota bacterium]